SSGLRRFFRYAMFIYSFYLCYSLSLYPFTEHYAQPYFFSCLIRQVANAARNYEILHERDDEDNERPDKRRLVIGISRPLSRVVTGATVIITTVMDQTGEVVVTTTAAATTTNLAVTTGIPVMGVTRETGVISPTDLPILFERDESHQYPSLLASFYYMHTRKGVWLHEEARLQYEEMIKLRDLGANTPTRVPYTEEEILAKVIKGKHRSHIAGRGRQVASAGKTKTDPRMAELLSQVGSRSEMGSGSGIVGESGEGGTDSGDDD
nr:hypothetical protein [Tanacetum cinerariifolium]